jgi:hypothetical protein
MSFDVIYCHFMSFHVITCHIMSYHVSLDYHSVKSWQGEGRGKVKYVFLGLRRQLCCQAEGKNTVDPSHLLLLPEQFQRKDLRRTTAFKSILIISEFPPDIHYDSQIVIL